MRFSYYKGFTPDGQSLIINFIPKSGCTTLANICLQLEDQHVAPNELNERGKYLLTHTNKHITFNEQQCWKIENADIKIAVKRDPVKRFLSFYRNRILFHNDLDELVSIDKLQQNFSQYIKHLKIRQHALPQIYYGGDISYYTHLYSMQDFSIIAEMLSDIYNKQMLYTYNKAVTTLTLN